MDDMQDQMNAILSNPEMMQKIMTMAQSLSSSPTPPSPENASGAQADHLPEIDLGMVQKLSGLAGQSNIDKDQRSLLKALGPYLSRERISKLEKAMRAAKMASMASVLLNQSGIHFPSGR